MTSATAFFSISFGNFVLDPKTGELSFSHNDIQSVYGRRNHVHFNLDTVLRISDSNARKGTVGFFDSEVANNIHLEGSIMEYNICPPDCKIERTYDLLQIFQTETGTQALKKGFKAESGVDLSLAFNDVIGILDRDVLSGKSGFIDSHLAYDIYLDDHNPCQMHYKAHLPGCHRTYNLLDLFIADVERDNRTSCPKNVRFLGEKIILDATPDVPTKRPSDSSRPTESIAETKGSSKYTEAPPKYQKDVDAKKPDVVKLEKDLKDKDVELTNAKTELEKLRKEQKSQTADGPTKDTSGEVEKLRGELKAMKTDAETKELRYKLDLAELKNQLKDAEIQRLKSSGQSPEQDGVDDFDF